MYKLKFKKTKKLIITLQSLYRKYCCKNTIKQKRREFYDITKLQEKYKEANFIHFAGGTGRNALIKDIGIIE